MEEGVRTLAAGSSAVGHNCSGEEDHSSGVAVRHMRFGEGHSHTAAAEGVSGIELEVVFDIEPEVVRCSRCTVEVTGCRKEGTAGGADSCRTAALEADSSAGSLDCCCGNSAPGKPCSAAVHWYSRIRLDVCFRAPSALEVTK